MASHKLTTYIAKNPPDADGTTSEPKTKEKSKSKRNATQAGNNNRDSDEGSPTESNEKPNGTSKSARTAGDDDFDPDNEDWGDDLPPTVEQITSQIKGMIQTDDLDKPLSERCEQFSHLIEKKKSERKLNDLATIKDLVAEAERLEIMEQAPFIVGQCAFTDNVLKEIDDYKQLLSKLCTKNAKGQKYLLHSLEALIGEHEDIRAKIFNKKAMSKILLKLYDEDIVEEDTFYTWHEKASKRFAKNKTIAKEIRDMAKDFIQWLRTAEESSDEEDEDGQLPEPEIDFTHTAGTTIEVIVEPVAKAPVDEKIEYDGEIIDVDNI